MGRKQKPTRVAVIGGGCAGIAAAWELTQPALRGQFEVTIYQMGWRLGGKGASGRGKDGRIEEHGLHLWMGHYDNAFRMMRECYEELGRDPRKQPIATWEDAFKPDPYVGLTDFRKDGSWARLMATFPKPPGLPGDPKIHSFPGSVSDYVSRCIRLILTLISAAGDELPAVVRDHEPATLEKELKRFIRLGSVVTLGTVQQALHTLLSVLRVLPNMSHSLVERFVCALTDSVQTLIEPLLQRDRQSQYVYEIADLMLAMVRGTIRFGLLTHPKGFDAIDEYDCREWFALNGASERALNSSFLRGLYDLAFAYEDGDPNKPRMAAGQGLRGGMRMFLGYRGALFWKMQAGMGDIVFAPFYEVLRRRGVRFEFFHRLTHIGLADKTHTPHIGKLVFDVQARTKSALPYEPLIEVNGLPCWPSEPDWKQLTGGKKLRRAGTQFESMWDTTRVAEKTLRVDRDFDFVVLGISLGAIPLVAGELIQRDERWAAMVANLKTVATQCFQVWLDAELADLGWNEASPNLSAYVEPFDTWADMSHLLDAENVQGDARSIAYFCNVLPTEPFAAEQLEDSELPRHSRERVRRNAVDFLNRHVGHLWPDATKKGQFRWSLVNQNGGKRIKDEKAFESQFWTANINPSDRYNQSLPGTSRFRISPLDESFDNLTIAGDWTDCGFNFGCVEAAVMSGRLAAHALSEHPPLREIDGYDHP